MGDSPANCDQYKLNFIRGLEPYQVLALTAPQNLTVWHERDLVWNVIFYVYNGTVAGVFLILGVIATFLLLKKDCARLQSKIFFTIYTCLAILSFSRAVWLVLDPFGLVGFISQSFPGWFIISRAVEALGFPSLSASYTLMIVALLKISTKPLKPWHHQWKMILPVVGTIYAIVFIAEVIALTAPYHGPIATIVCEYLFAICGVILCGLFLIAGNRLLRKLNYCEKKSIHVCTSEMDPRTRTFTNKELQRHQLKTRKTKRKIVTITYATVVFSIFYSLITGCRAVITTYLIFGLCLGYQGRMSPTVWLVFEIFQRVIEVVLALILLYSITDITVVMRIVCHRREHIIDTN